MEKEEIRRQRNKDKFSSDALFWIKLANQRVFDFNKQLLNVGLILLPLTASIVVVNIKLNESEKTLLFLGWVFLAISTICGCIQAMIDAHYFRYLSNDSSRREEIWSSNRTTEEMDIETRALGQVRNSSTHLPLWFQVYNLLLALVLIMIFAGSLILRK